MHCSSWCKSFPSFPFTQKSARRHTKRRAIFFAPFHTMTTLKAWSNEVLPTCYISQLIVCNLTQVTTCLVNILSYPLYNLCIILPFFLRSYNFCVIAYFPLSSTNCYQGSTPFPVSLDAFLSSVNQIPTNLHNWRQFKGTSNGILCWNIKLEWIEFKNISYKRPASLMLPYTLCSKVISRKS